uniref:LEF-3 late expression factor 3 n=1 Tax=Spodoptera littoralis nuclear polyhedrosis virus TaxID=10456 RepID=A0A3G4S8V1_NPVSL|nr:LEF-3 late expression factor 3 [Spodoptera littoralis nucleopolyhedrovirus]
MKRQLSNGDGGNQENNGSGVPLKKPAAGSYSINFKETKGELIGKNMISLNNELFYIMKFFIENGNKDYYGNMQQYTNMEIGKTYKINLKYANRRLIIDRYSEDKTVELRVDVKDHLLYEDFMEDNIVTIETQFLCGFRPIFTNYIKFVFNVKYKNERDQTSIMQVESICDTSRAMSLFNVETHSALFKRMMELEKKFLKLTRVKCVNNKNNFKNLSFLEMSKIEVTEDCETPPFDCDDFVGNISRNNKQIYHAKVTSFKVNTMSNNNIKIVYRVEDYDQDINGVIFLNNDRKDTKNNEYEKVLLDLNQTADTIGDLNDVYIYTSSDINGYYTVLGLTCYDLSNFEYVPI